MSNINQEVAKRIASSGADITERVIAHLAEEEIKRRADKVVQTVVEINKLTKSLDKVQPDVVSYNEDGTVANKAWSKNKLEEKKKLTDKIAKLQKALDKALDQSDFGELLGLQFGKDDSAE